MKLNSPFLLLLLSYFVLSCTDKDSTEPTQTETAIATHLQHIANDSIPKNKLQHAEKAITLAKKANNPTLLYRSVCIKMNDCIIPAYPDSIPYYLGYLLKLARKTENPASSHAYVLLLKGNYELGLQHYKKAFQFYFDSKSIFEKEKDSARTAYGLLKIAEVQQIFNDYSGSEETITEVLKLLENMKDPNLFNLREAYNKLGISYTGLLDYKEAIRYYTMAKRITDDPIARNIVDNNIALCYLEEGKYEQAVKMLQVLYASDVTKNDPNTFAKVNDNLGNATFKRDKNSGKELMEKALAIRTSQSDEKGMVYSYLNLSEYYQSKNPALATQYAEKAYALATKVDAIDNRIKALKLLTIFDSKDYDKEYIRLDDSIEYVERKAKNEFAKIRFDATSERNKNAANEIEKARTEVRNLNRVIVLGSIIVVIIGLSMVIISKYKKQKKEERYKTETRIAKKLHDELANDVFNAMTFAELQDLSTSENKGILLDNLDKIYAQTRNISKENNNIDTGEKYLLQLKEMLSGYGSEEVNILIKEIESIDWKSIEASKKIVVYRVLQELLVNMKKHSKAKLVVISFIKTNKKIQVVYQDNGVGMAPYEHLHKNGLQNVENRIQSINGTITFDPIPQKGVKVSFSFNS